MPETATKYAWPGEACTCEIEGTFNMDCIYKLVQSELYHLQYIYSS